MVFPSLNALSDSHITYAYHISIYKITHNVCIIYS